MTARVRCLFVASSSHLSNHTGILLESFDRINEHLEKSLPPTQDQLLLAEAVFPLTPPLSDDSDVPDGCHYKGKSSIKTIHAGDTAARLRKSSHMRPRIQRHRGFSKCKYGHPWLSLSIGMQGHSSETLTLHLVSPDTGKPTIAAVADSHLRKAAGELRRKAVPVVDAELFEISVSDLQNILEGTGI